MRFICLFSALFFAGIIFEAKASTFKNLSCTLELEDPKDSEKSVFNYIQIFGQNELNGSVTFRFQLTSLPSYYFRLRSGRPSPVYHTDAKFEMEATLNQDELVYTTKYFNYAYGPDKLMQLKTEKRMIDVRDLEQDKKIFLNDEARLLDQNILGGRYVNQDGAKLVKCELRDLEYKSVNGPWRGF